MAFPESNYPQELDKSGSSLLQGVDATTTFVPAGRLQIGIDAETLVLRVVGVDFTKLPDRGLVTVGDEQIRYVGKDDQLQELYVPQVTLRGYGGTTPTVHAQGTSVCWLMTSQHLASIHAAIEATQKHIGVRGSTDPESIEYRLAQLQQDGNYEQYEVEMTTDIVAARHVSLPCAVKNPTKVRGFVINGIVLDNGEDYAVSSTDPAIISWAGLGLDGLVSASDKLMFVYERN